MKQINKLEFEKQGLKIKEYDLQWARPLAQSKTQTTHIVVHHDMWPGGTLDQIHNDHIRNRGFRGVGYNFRVRKDGTIERGRPVGIVTAHCKEQKMNFRSIGIVLEGCYTDYKNLTEKEVPKAQIDSTQRLIQMLLREYDIELENVKRHHDFATYKDCPGRYFLFEKLMKMIKSNSKADKSQEVSPWAQQAWEWAKENGINDGVGPKNVVTEEQLMVFLKRYNGIFK